VVVVPSYNESFGLVAIEAQACGTPVVAASVGGLGTAVRHGESGLLVAGHDPADYAEACAQLLDNPAARARMGETARRHAAQFGWGETARRTLEVYDEARALTGAEAAAVVRAPL
jgi:D-inositol-3-phosphate glycosyltransferase